MPGVDHIDIVVPEAKLDETVKFLIGSLQYMGFKEIMRPEPNVVGLGDEMPWFWVSGVPDFQPPSGGRPYLHIAFTAENSAQVKQFHADALKAGGKDYGAPGLRPQYHPQYYGAFVICPGSGINFEAVCHKGEI